MRSALAAEILDRAVQISIEDLWVSRQEREPVGARGRAAKQSASAIGMLAFRRAASIILAVPGRSSIEVYCRVERDLISL